MNIAVLNRATCAGLKLSMVVYGAVLKISLSTCYGGATLICSLSADTFNNTLKWFSLLLPFIKKNGRNWQISSSLKILVREVGHERSKYTAVLNNDKTLFLLAKLNTFLIKCKYDNNKENSNCLVNRNTREWPDRFIYIAFTIRNNPNEVRV